MKRKFSHPDSQRNQQPDAGNAAGPARSGGKNHQDAGFDPFDALTHDRLDIRHNAPDFTRSIMGRLGYMKAAPAAVRRRRIRLWANRVGVVVLTGAALLVSMHLYEHSPQARRPDGPTIPAALGRDLQQQQHRLGTMIHTIRSLSPRIEFEPILEEDEGDNENEWFDEGPDALPEDVNQSSIAPIRWV